MKARAVLTIICSVIGLQVLGDGLSGTVPEAKADTLTFPPASDCAFLGGDAQRRCEARRSGAASEIAKVTSGEIKTKPPLVRGSGATFTPLTSDGMLGGYGESNTIVPAENAAPTRSAPYNPNSIGNPWSGTPYRDGTGLPPN